VLLPGLDGTGLLFQPLVAALPDWIEPVVIRYPGDRHLSYQELFPLVIDALPRSRPFIILGESFSGPLSAMVAAQRPQGLIGLILCATFVTPPWQLVSPLIHTFSRPPFSNLYLPLKRLKAKFGGYSTPQFRKIWDEMDTLVQSDVMASRVRMVFRVDARQSLRASNVPIIYLKGTSDLVVPGWNARAIQQIVPAVRVVCIDAPHMVLQRKPAEAASAISDFANSL